VRGLEAGPFGITLLVTAAALLVLMIATFGVALKASPWPPWSVSSPRPATGSPRAGTCC